MVREKGFFFSLLVSLSLWSCLLLLLLLLRCHRCDKSASLGQGFTSGQRWVGLKSFSLLSLSWSSDKEGFSWGFFFLCLLCTSGIQNALSLSWEIEEDNKTKQNCKLTTIFFLEFSHFSLICLLLFTFQSPSTVYVFCPEYYCNQWKK